VSTITLNRPERKNPLTFESYAELRDLFRQLSYASDVKTVVVTGAGGNFCSGGDVHEIIGPLVRMQEADDMNGLLSFRSTVGAAALGFARRALDEAIKHATTRKLFGQPLSDLQMTRSKLSDMALAIDAAALLIYRAAWTKDVKGARISRESSMAKLFATEEAQKVIDSAVQIFGGLGVTRGHIAESLYREIRALRIYEGASEVQKLVIATRLLADAQA
jgi:alkylation response protein AidB-like acyl-CoA dehydrogenase